jgi:hypothetical protein
MAYVYKNAPTARSRRPSQIHADAASIIVVVAAL